MNSGQRRSAGAQLIDVLVGESRRFRKAIPAQALASDGEGIFAAHTGTGRNKNRAAIFSAAITITAQVFLVGDGGDGSRRELGIYKFAR